ncbi:MAG TPA: hypothetical protein PKE26_16430 [Kiritimatiellia bacterium]|nr:hypothetical protein [Kiritimatiellia bacterium]HMP00684.1 hypothetical protein [Kiritimatiellia bacterium]
MTFRFAIVLMSLATTALLQGCVAGSPGYVTNVVIPGYELGRPVEVELHLHLRHLVSPASRHHYCYYRYNEHDNYSVVPLELKEKDRGSRIYRYGCSLPPFNDDRERLEYYFEFVFQGVTNTTKHRILTREGFVQ